METACNVPLEFAEEGGHGCVGGLRIEQPRSPNNRRVPRAAKVTPGFHALACTQQRAHITWGIVRQRRTLTPETRQSVSRAVARCSMGSWRVAAHRATRAYLLRHRASYSALSQARQSQITTRR